MNQIARIIDNVTIEVYDLTQFDTDAIMHSGQIFRYFKTGCGYSLVAGKEFADIKNQDGKIIIECSNSRFFYDYFDLETDYNEIKRHLYAYQDIRAAIKAGGGIRILRADFNETVISFIISANNNIKRFTKTLNALAERCADKLANGLYSFPSTEQLSVLTEADYKALGCGYRAPYLVKAVEQLKALNVSELQKMSDSKLDEALLSICGVGKKVCACIKLFSVLHRLNTCPVDTWISKALAQINANDRAALLNHQYAGVAQQYIFYYLQYLRGNL